MLTLFTGLVENVRLVRLEQELFFPVIILSLLACMIRDSAEKEVRILFECVCVCEYVDA